MYGADSSTLCSRVVTAKPDGADARARSADVPAHSDDHPASRPHEPPPRDRDTTPGDAARTACACKPLGTDHPRPDRRRLRRMQTARSRPKPGPTYPEWQNGTQAPARRSTPGSGRADTSGATCRNFRIGTATDEYGLAHRPRHPYRRHRSTASRYMFACLAATASQENHMARDRPASSNRRRASASPKSRSVHAPNASSSQIRP